MKPCLFLAGLKTRSVRCVKDHTVILEALCSQSQRPSDLEICRNPQCRGVWVLGAWSQVLSFPSLMSFPLPSVHNHLWRGLTGSLCFLRVAGWRHGAPPAVLPAGVQARQHHSVLWAALPAALAPGARRPCPPHEGPQGDGAVPGRQQVLRPPPGQVGLHVSGREAERNLLQHLHQPAGRVTQNTDAELTKQWSLSKEQHRSNQGLKPHLGHTSTTDSAKFIQ